MNNTDKIGNVADKLQHSVGGSAGALVSGHTKGPWRVSLTNPFAVEASCEVEAGVEGSRLVAACDELPHNGRTEDAARIVACVNACEGYDNGVLERNPMSALWLAASKAENDALALRALTAELVEGLTLIRDGMDSAENACWLTSKPWTKKERDAVILATAKKLLAKAGAK